MKFLIILALLLGCSNHLHNHNGKAQSTRAMREIAKIIKQNFSYPEDALAFIRTHPFAKTIGIHSNTVARELDIYPAVWGRYVNAESDLVTQQIMVDGRSEKFIFAKGFTPQEQIDKALNSLSKEQLERGVPIATVADKVSFGQESWTDHGFHTSIGHLIDRKEYVSQLIKADGRSEKFIFAKGFTPQEQIDKALNSLSKEQLERGVPIEQVADKVSFGQESWTDHGFHTSIGHLIDRKEYVSQLIKADGRSEKFIFAKGFTPQEQIDKALNSLSKEQLERGVPIAQVADKVSFRQEGLTDHGFHISIGHLLDRKKYVSQQIKVDGRSERLIFAKGFTPQEQIDKALNSLSKEQLERGVPIAQVADKVSFRQEGLTDNGFHNSIGQLLDRKKYVSQNISVDGRSERLIFAKGFTPKEQLDEALNSLSKEQLERGVPIAQVADKVSFRQEGCTDKGFHTSIGQLLDRKKYVSQNISVDDRSEKFIFAKGFTPQEQIDEVLNSLPQEQLERGVPISQVADKVSFRQEGLTDHGFHISIGHLLDRKKYVSQQTKVDGRSERLIFAKGFTPQEQIDKALNSLSKEQLERGVPIAQVADKVSFRQEGWTDNGFHTSIGLLLDRKKYVSQHINGDTYIFAIR